MIPLWKAKYDGSLHQQTKLIILQPQKISWVNKTRNHTKEFKIRDVTHSMKHTSLQIIKFLPVPKIPKNEFTAKQEVVIQNQSGKRTTNTSTCHVVTQPLNQG
jgi:hypothetical protein